MRVPIIFVLFLSTTHCLSQFEEPVKEQFDHVAHKLNFGPYEGVISYIVDNPLANPWSGNEFGEQVGYFLEGYLRMYETTQDKAYLIRFINLSLKSMAWRNSDFLFTTATGGDDEAPYMNGVMLWPMAHFVHLILVENNGLADLPIPDGLLQYQNSTGSVNILPYNSAHTYSTIATWIMYRCVESMDAVIDAHWNADNGFCRDVQSCAVNLQAGFAGALLYLGHLGNSNSSYSGLLSYLDKGAVLASLFSGQEPDDRCSCIEGQEVLEVQNNSYTWNHKALNYKLRPCAYLCWGSPGFSFQETELEGIDEFVEDISHGVIDLIIPTLSHRFGLFTNSAYPFTEIDLVRFRNTFTQNIAQWDGLNWQFRNAVNGDNGPVSSCQGCNAYLPESSFKTAALGWMPLQTFDSNSGAESGPGVYEIVSHFYSNEIFTNPSNIYGGLYHYGTAEVVAAQWERECFSLNLYNRELVYDQDFAAKKVLRVFPEGEAGGSFADPVIYVPRFTVNEHIRSQFRAGNAVIFEPGFEAVDGSVVEAVIDPMGCDLAYKAAIPTYGRTEVALRLDKDNEPVQDPPLPTLEYDAAALATDGLRLVPNPSSGQAFAILQLEQASDVTITLLDGTGRSVWSSRPGRLPAGEHRLPLAPIFARGIYQCLVNLDGVPLMERLVVE